MDNILPRKYNNKVVIGLGIALLAAVGVAVYYYMREPTTQKHTAHAHQHTHAHPPNHQRPEQVETRIGDNKPALLLIWAGWCGYSTKMKPTWDKVVSILNKDGAIDVVELVDPDNKDEIAKARPNIPEFRGYPHIRFYPDGYAFNKKSVPYEGDMSEESILKFAYQSFGT
jgi:thiol-disulfide isomerase/thioredoxin